MLRKGPILLTATAVAMMLGGCGAEAGSSSPPGAANGGAPHGATSGKDPCSLITRAEAEAAMAEPANGDGKSSAGECKFSAGGADGSDSLTLLVGKPDVLKKVVTSNGVGGTVSTETVSGLGDEAIFAPGLETMYVRKGSSAFTIQIATLAAVQANKNQKDAATTAAQAVLGRL